MTTTSPTRPPHEWALVVLACALAAINLGLGLSLLTAGPLRTSAVSFDPIKAVAPIHWWGLLFIVTGVAALAAQVGERFRAMTAAHFTAGAVCMFWAAAFAAGLSNPAASATGIWAYLALGVSHVTVAVTARH